MGIAGARMGSLGGGCRRSWQWGLAAEAASKAENAQAARLVDETLRREAREAIDSRRELLRPALEMAPPYEAAYGPSGFAYDLKRRGVAACRRKSSSWPPRMSCWPHIAKRGRELPDNEQRADATGPLVRSPQLNDQARAHWTRVLSSEFGTAGGAAASSASRRLAARG